MNVSKGDFLRGVALFLLVLVAGCSALLSGCGSGGQRIPRAHWAADADGVVRVTYRFPQPEQATNIHPEVPLIGAREPTEALKEAAKKQLARWQEAALREGIRLEFYEARPGDASARVDIVLATVEPGYAAQYFPWQSNLDAGELGRIVLKVSPDLPPVRLEEILAHECGHLIGLPEIYVDRAVMNPRRRNTTITGSDTAELVRHYPTFSIL